MIFVIADEGGLVSVPLGFEIEFQTQLSTANLYPSLFVKIADGSEGNTSVDLVTELAATMSVQVLNVEGWYGVLGDGIEHSIGAYFANDTPSPPSLTVPWPNGDTLFLAVCFTADDDATVLSYPSGFTNGTTAISGGGPNDGSTVGIASLESTALTVEPPDFLISELEGHVSFTVGIRPLEPPPLPGDTVFPVVEEVLTQGFSSTLSSQTVNLPTTVNDGDLLLISASTYDSGVINTPTGFTSLFSDEINASGYLLCCAKVADGSESASTVTLSFQGSSSTAATQVHRISSWSGDIASGIGLSLHIGSASLLSSLDPPALTAPWGSDKNLWIASSFYTDDDISPSSYPPGYTGTVAVSGGGSNNGCSVATAYKVALSGSEDPGNFNLTGSEYAKNYTMVIRPFIVPDTLMLSPSGGIGVGTFIF